MGAVMGGDGDAFDRSAFAVRELLGLKSRKYRHELLGALAVVQILDARQHVGWIRDNPGLERH